ncbi:hypothetical protein [Devosia faecipullorum]|nr:hypothetical protein [Devosia faecipullorum]MBE7734176.1 hypothetical protein [Devosia faecipullorum]
MATRIRHGGVFVKPAGIGCFVTMPGKGRPCPNRPGWLSPFATDQFAPIE